MAKRKLELTLNSAQKDDNSILRTLKKLTGAVSTNEQESTTLVTTQPIDNTVAIDTLTQVVTQVVAPASTLVSSPVNLSEDTRNFLTQYEETLIDSQKSSKPTKSSKTNLTKNPKTLSGLAEMAKWHTEAEQKVYKAMYQEAKNHDTKELYFTFLTLAEKTGFKNPRTIRLAIQGLIAKKSIAELTNKHGDHLGIKYQIFSPEEIINNRHIANININFQSKKIE